MTQLSAFLFWSNFVWGAIFGYCLHVIIINSKKKELNTPRATQIAHGLK